MESATAERAVGILLIVLGTIVRCFYTQRHQVNPDEPQHLHVAWGWTHGLLPYRDLFDNHSPLFSAVCAPFLALAGPRPDIVVVMRWVMVPMVLVTLWALWHLVRALFGPRAALWSVAIAGVEPDLVLRGVEYRSDVLWTMCWTLFLASVLCGRVTRRRMLASGLLLGAAFAVSMKTSLLTVALLCGLVPTLVLLARRGWRVPARVAALAGWFVAGAATVPAILAGFFAWRGALPQLRYAVFTHNIVPGLGTWQESPWLPLLFLPAFPLMLWVAARLLRSAPSPGAGGRRALLFLASAIYWLAVQTTWPLVTRQDWLPLVPMATALVAPLLLAGADALARRRGGSPALARHAAWAMLVLAVVIEGVVLWRGEPILEDRTLPQQEILREVLRLTVPADSVLDPRGEAIFRDRPYYYVCEAVTLTRMEKGLIPDRIPERLVSSRIGVVYWDSEDYPPRARCFMRRNFIQVGAWRVAGAVVPAAADAGTRSFRIGIPQRYALLSANGPARGSLDGRPYAGPVELAPGRHTYAPAIGEGVVVALWAPAAERAFSPFPFLAAAASDSAPPTGGAPATSERVMVIAPHPDDETLAAGELLARAASHDIPTSILFVTDGDNNPWSQLASEGRWPLQPSDRRHWGARRQEESREALARLGVLAPSVQYLHLPDQRVTECLFDGSGAAVERMVAAIRAFQPTLLVVPSKSDQHPDHSATSVLADLALARLGDGERPRRVLEYVIHPWAGRRAVPGSERGTRPPPASPLLTAKRNAIGCYRSQFLLRGHFLRRFADVPESLNADTRLEDAVPPARVLPLSGDLATQWSIQVRGSIRLVFGNPQLMLVGYRGTQTTVACISPLRTGRVAIVDAVTGEPLGQATVRRSAMDLEVELSTPSLQRWSAGFFKLDLARERQFGLFDVWGWQRIPVSNGLPDGRPASVVKAWHRGSRSRERSVSLGMEAPPHDVLTAHRFMR
jgi:LmbE family N-acetylglucosaminyl deacetylase